MKLKSPAFRNNGEIPSKYTCDGENINPPLQVEDIPEGTASLVLVVDDPDVPKHLREDGMWDHWIVWNIPILDHIDEDSVPGTQGLTTSKKHNYSGPCPTDWKHRYFFKLYALDAKLSISENSTKKEVEKAMQGHILEKTELIGLYERKK